MAFGLFTLDLFYLVHVIIVVKSMSGFNGPEWPISKTYFSLTNHLNKQMHTFFYFVDFLCDVVTLANWNLRINEIYWFACCVLVRLFLAYVCDLSNGKPQLIYLYMIVHRNCHFLNGHFSWVKSCFCFVVAFLAQNDKHCICSHSKCLVQTYCFVYKTYYISIYENKNPKSISIFKCATKIVYVARALKPIARCIVYKTCKLHFGTRETIVCNCWMIMRRSFCLWHNKCRLFCEANVQ